MTHYDKDVVDPDKMMEELFPAHVYPSVYTVGPSDYIAIGPIVATECAPYLRLLANSVTSSYDKNDGQAEMVDIALEYSYYFTAVQNRYESVRAKGCIPEYTNYVNKLFKKRQEVMNGQAADEIEDWEGTMMQLDGKLDSISETGEVTSNDPKEVEFITGVLDSLKEKASNITFAADATKFYGCMGFDYDELLKQSDATPSGFISSERVPSPFNMYSDVHSPMYKDFVRRNSKVNFPSDLNTDRADL